MYTESLSDEFLHRDSKRSQKYVVFRDSIFSDLFFPHKIEDIFHRKEDLSFLSQEDVIVRVSSPDSSAGRFPS